MKITRRSLLGSILALPFLARLGYKTKFITPVDFALEEPLGSRILKFSSAVNLKCGDEIVLSFGSNKVFAGVITETRLSRYSKEYTADGFGFNNEDHHS